jgi:alpha-1,2-mannosyltransferase
MSARRVVERSAVVFLFLGVPLVLTVVQVAWALERRGIGADLWGTYIGAAQAILDGHTPYLEPGDPGLGVGGTAYIYPPVLALLVTPLTVVSTGLVVDVGIVVSVVLVVAILWLAGVRDWRCFGVALIWPSVGNELDTLNVSVLIALVLALAWRLRGSSYGSGALIGLAVAVKMFVAPCLVWLLATRRVHGAVTGVVVATALVFLSWAAIGFTGLVGFPDLIRAVDDAQAPQSYSLFAAASALHVPAGAARALGWAVALGLVAIAWREGRKGNDPCAFAAAVLASLAATPILWQHYLVLLLLALAVASPRLGPAWFLPLAIWPAPRIGNGGLFTTLLVPGVAVAVAAFALWSADRAGAGRALRYENAPA